MLERLVEKLPPSLVVAVWRRLPKTGRLKRFLQWHGNTRFVAGVVGLVCAENGDLLVLRHTYKAMPWGLPCGALKREQPTDGLVREVREEAGFEIRPEAVLDTIYSSNPPELLVVVKARLVGGLFRPSAEVSGYGFIRPPERMDRLSAFQRGIVEKYHLK